MKEADYKDLEAALLEDWRSALAAFVASPDNVGVYALAAQFHPEYAQLILSLNTERGFDQIVARYPDDAIVDMRRFGGTRWNPGDFLHTDIAPASAATNRLTERFVAEVEKSSERGARTQATRLADAMVSAIEKMSGSFHTLDRTPDFIAYVWPNDANESELIAFARRTVPMPVFERLFPEVLETETFMTNLGRRPKAEQAAFWAGALRDLVLETPSASAQMLRTLARTKYDAADALVKLGPAATLELVRIAEEHALAEEWNDRDSEEWQRRGASTRRGELASSSLLALKECHEGSDEIIGRLQALLQRLYERDRARPLAGVNGQLTARALHALRPRVFPAARFSDSSNHLLNFTAFGGNRGPN